MFEKSEFIMKVSGSILIIAQEQNVLSKMKRILLVYVYPSFPSFH